MVPRDETAIREEEAYRWVYVNCPICEIAPKKFLGRRGGAAHREGLGVECKIFECGRCGLIFSNPMPMPALGVEQHYSLEADHYFQHHDIDEKGLATKGMLQRAADLTGGKGRLLDIGAGRGELLRTARQEGWLTIGIEPSAPFADYAADYSGVEIIRQPVERCRFENSSFDVVILAGVLEHLYNPDDTIKEIARIIRPGGALYLDVPNEKGLYFKVGNAYQRLRGRNWVVNLAPTFSPFHVFGFSPRPLHILLAKYSFRPRFWRVYGGRAVLPCRRGLFGLLEQLGTHMVTAVSNLGNLGTYIETWATRH